MRRAQSARELIFGLFRDGGEGGERPGDLVGGAARLLVDDDARQG